MPPDLQFPADPDRRALRVRSVAVAAAARARARRRKAFVVTDPGVRQSGIVDAVTEVLERDGDRVRRSTISVTADSGSTLICEARGRAESSGRRRRCRRRRRQRARHREGRRGAGDEPRFAARLCRPAQDQEPAAADDGDADDRRYRQRGELLVGLHRRQPTAEGRDRRRSAVSDGGVVRSGARRPRLAARADRIDGDGRARARDRVLH